MKKVSMFLLGLVLSVLSFAAVLDNGFNAAFGPMSVDAAISQAARDTLAALFPSQTATFDAYLTQDLAAIRNPQQKANGIDLGHRTAAAILAMRVNDGSQLPEPHVGVDYFQRST